MYRTHYIRSTTFRRLESCSEMCFKNPPGFHLDGAAYVLVCLPWISRHEWHAFSLFPHPTQPNSSAVCVAAVGDWSKKLHALILRPTHRPAWVAGPFTSPYSRAIESDHLITIASGIGITPALALVSTAGGHETRSINLIWVCRDASLIEFYLRTLDSSATNHWTLIYYTGKRNLVLDTVPVNVYIFKKRPDLEKVHDQ